MAFTTDTYVVNPLFFPGGDIGKLAVHGTVNDLAMAGAEPLYLSAGFILEEGFPIADLRRIIASMAQAATDAGVISLLVIPRLCSVVRPMASLLIQRASVSCAQPGNQQRHKFNQGTRSC